MAERMTRERKTTPTGSKARRKKRGAGGSGHVRGGAFTLAGLRDLRGLAGWARSGGLSRLLAMPVPAVLAGGLAASLAAPIAVTRVADGVLSRQTRSLDHKVTGMARGQRRFGKRPLDPIMTVLSAAGDPRVLYPVTAFVAARLVAEERADDAVTLALGLVGSAGITGVLKHIVHRPRPIWRLPFPRSTFSGTSFPSNHATMSLATYGMIAYLSAWKPNTKQKGAKDKDQAEQAATDRRLAARVWAPVLLFCGLIGWSRVYQGVHNPSDVLGGWLAGGIWLLACSTAANYAQAR